MENLSKRQSSLLDIVSKKHFISIKDLSKALNVSEMTVRRDITSLAGEKLIKQVYGGIIPADSYEKYNLSDEQSKRTDLKIRIAQKALTLLNNNDVLYLDSGTTVQTLASILPNEPYTIITNSFASLEAVTKLEDCTVITLGGVFSHKPRVFYNQDPDFKIPPYRANKCFIGATGVSMKLGVTCSYTSDVPIKKAMLKSSSEKILLVDSSKFEQVSICAFATIDEFTKIVTDDGIPTEYKKEIEDHGIEVIVC